MAEGPAEMFEQNDVKVKDGMLCVKMKDLRKKMGMSKKEFDEIPKVSVTEETGGRKVLNDPERLKQFGDCIVVWPMVLYVTAPTLDVVENNGALTLSTGDMAVADLDIFNKGQLDLSLGNVECSGLRIENKGVFKGGGDFNAGTVALENKGNMELVSDFSVSGAFDLKNNGTSKFNGSISAAQAFHKRLQVRLSAFPAAYIEALFTLSRRLSVPRRTSLMARPVSISKYPQSFHWAI